MKQYRAKNGKLQWKPAFSRLQEVSEFGEFTGFCLACGNEQDGCEQDIRHGICESCSAAKVYGAEELILMGLYHSDAPAEADHD